ncbi:predicted protein [Aspergillus nidulans FGSC A4]|uniref:Uncharacterized protein n=1 Tax=Emericella nidulans (strain FGSC A4 / ATCC 38163 / CBS 112.46 / NRRL 194 / M139) TaxID=227321 RepID=Q5BBX2_EMENI|nr:hypothetical protein [Aspergillus nidulans FGSC A4]EAA65123.1 predicted protein [Aspergillus nidulans FGSC A4]CBF85896.1 TPA: conserved hypothetical protein [Aspergillus nidulans FGSC A4]|eukprot:XP_659562.1 predicted protein [Aspergillus nidulans FGSC A4]
MVDWNAQIRAPDITHYTWSHRKLEKLEGSETLRWRPDTGLVTCIAGSIVNGHRPAVTSAFRLAQVAELKSDLILPASPPDLLGPANVRITSDLHGTKTRAPVGSSPLRLENHLSPRAQPWSA